MPSQRFFLQKFKLLLQLLAFLVCNCAGSFGCGLAGSLALAAAALLYCILKISGIQSFDSFHWKHLSFLLTAPSRRLLAIGTKSAKKEVCWQ